MLPSSISFAFSDGSRRFYRNKVEIGKLISSKSKHWRVGSLGEDTYCSWIFLQEGRSIDCDLDIIANLGFSRKVDRWGQGVFDMLLRRLRYL